MLGLPKVPWHVPNAHTKFGWNDNFFPVGAWPESILSAQDAQRLVDLNVNTIVTPNADSKLNFAKDAGLFVLLQGEDSWGWPIKNATVGSETVGWWWHDEPDMFYGAGWGAWNGKTYTSQASTPGEPGCGFTVLMDLRAKFDAAGTKPYVVKLNGNFEFWMSRDNAAKFLNGDTSTAGRKFIPADVTLVDPYFYTNTNYRYSNHGGVIYPGTGGADGLSDGLGASHGQSLTPQERMKASNYGGVLRLVCRPLDARDGKYSPLWGSVEVLTQDKTVPLTPQQIQGAAISYIINGARGITWFQYQVGAAQLGFRDPAQTQMQAAVKAIGAHFKELAPYINAGWLQWDFACPQLDASISELADGSVLVLAQQTTGNYSGTYKIKLPFAGKMVSVFDWQGNKTTPAAVAVDGTVSLSFANEWEWREIRFSPGVVLLPPVIPPPGVTNDQLKSQLDSMWVDIKAIRAKTDADLK